MRFDPSMKLYQPTGEQISDGVDRVVALAGDWWSNLGMENGASQSGSEANDLFVGVPGPAGFVDCSGVSGIDAPQDGRVLVPFDLDGDGWLDLAVTNADEPRLQIFSNTLGRTSPNRSVRVELAGAGAGHTNREGIGARIAVETADGVIVREMKAGEGLAAQGGSAEVIGVGTASEVRVTARWGDGTESGTTALAGSTVRLIEGGPARTLPQSATPLAASSGGGGTALPGALARLLPRGGALVLVTFATWCDACVTELPDLAALSQKLGDGVRVLGVPVDPLDDSGLLSEWMAARAPPWALVDLPAGARAEVRAWFEAGVGYGAVPSFALIHGGSAVAYGVGPPSLSRVRGACSGR